MSQKIIKADATASSRPLATASLLSVTRGSAKVIDREVFAAHDHARTIVDSARQEADEHLAQAQSRARVLRRRAVERAYRHCLARWERRFAELEAARDRMFEEAKPQIVELSLWVASKILRRRISQEPEVVAGMVEEALRSVRGSAAGRMVLTVHPDDRAAVERVRQSMVARDPRWDIVVVAAEQGMARGGCRVETEFGEIDATVETQLRAIRQILLNDN